ncbi:hypothetical protein EON65_49820 [archaeon]|nr:MAG: hypothetical protein EON65_49820 [archaeon]
MERDRHSESNHDELHNVESGENDLEGNTHKEDSKVAKLQFMITNKMRHTLVDELGYLPSEVC